MRSRTSRASLGAGLILIALGLERLLNAYLLGAPSAGASTRLLIAILCLGAGAMLTAFAGYHRLRR